MALRVVRPPRTTDGKLVRVPHRGRPSTARPKPVIAVSADAQREAATKTGAVPPPHRDASAAKRSAALQTQRGDVAVRDLHLADIDSWPSTASSRLLDTVGKHLAAGATCSDTVLRADAAVDAIKALGTHMPTYRAAFDALAVEMHVLVARVEDSGNEVAMLQDELARVRREGIDDLAAATLRFEVERRKWQETRDGRDDEIAEMKHQLVKLKRENNALLTEREVTARANEETTVLRLQYEQMATSFAERNKALTDKVAELETLVETEQERAWKATAARNNYSQLVHSLEEASAREAAAYKVGMGKLQEALDAATAKVRVAHTTIGALKESCARAEAEARDAVAEYEKLKNQYESDAATWTPRPDFLERDMPVFGRLTSTANRTAALSDKLHAGSRALEEMRSEHAMLSRAAFLGDAAREGLKFASPKVSAQLVAPVGTSCSGKVVPMLVTNQPFVRVRIMPLREVVTDIRTQLNLRAQLQSRSEGRVELHTSLLYHLQEKFVQHPPVAEAAYTFAFNVRAWAAVPIVRVAGCILREEVGAWMFAAMNDFVAATMRRLAACAGASVADHLVLLRALMREAKFGEASAAAASAQFLRLYATQMDAMSRSASLRFDDAADDHEHSYISVEYDESKHAPSSMANTTELPFVGVLRRIYLERALTLYATLDREVAGEANGTRVTHGGVVRAMSRVVPALPQATVTAFVNDLFAQCAAHAAAEKKHEKGFKKDLEGAVLSNRALFLPGMTRWVSAPGQYPRMEAYVPAEVDAVKSPRRGGRTKSTANLATLRREATAAAEAPTGEAPSDTSSSDSDEARPESPRGRNQGERLRVAVGFLTATKATLGNIRSATNWPLPLVQRMCRKVEFVCDEVVGLGQA